MNDEGDDFIYEVVLVHASVFLQVVGFVLPLGILVHVFQEVLGEEMSLVLRIQCVNI